MNNTFARIGRGSVGEQQAWNWIVRNNISQKNSTNFQRLRAVFPNVRRDQQPNFRRMY